MSLEAKLTLWEHYICAEKKDKKTKKYKYYDSCTYTTGDIDYNLKQFNKHMGTDFSNPSTEEARLKRADSSTGSALNTSTATNPSDSVGATSTSSNSASTAVGENLNTTNEETQLQEAKRYVRRYYIRPQNIFCSNKTDILKALIKIGAKNCSVYTLNNLGDNKDVTKLTTKDIIYYYDDGILYDKNHVKIFDYDLNIKHEEKRDRVNTDNISDQKFNTIYSDRMTDSTTNEAFNLAFNDINAYGEILREGKIVNNICSICGEKINGTRYSTKPYSSKEDAECCEACYMKFIKPTLEG